MENITDALKYAFAVICLVIALSVVFMMFSKARVTSEIVFYMNDKINFYEYNSSDEALKGRIVGVETVIPTLYRYYKENYIVNINDKNGNNIEKFDLNEEAEKFNKKPLNAPWMGDPNKDAKKRIDLFVSGKSDIINTYYTVNYIGKGLLENYGNSKFLETVKISDNSYNGVIKETEDGEKVETIKGEKKLEITYTLQ